MNLERLLIYFETSPATRLLQARNAPYIVSFLHQAFKRGAAGSLAESELLAALIAFQEQVQETYADVLISSASAYLAEWKDSGWLKRSWQGSSKEAVYQLTPAAEHVIQFLDRHHEEELGFVGTQSRLRSVIETLEELVIGASDDPNVHLEHLRKDREQIDQEIARIESDGFVASYHPARIREQFTMAVSLLKELQRDFRSVEEQFRAIALQVQQRQLQGVDSRGGILGAALDAEDELRSQDQGVSFYEFFSLIQSPQQQERLRSIVQRVVRLPELAEQSEGLETIRRMKSVLLAEAAQVTQTERRLSATLRRLLDVRVQRERQRIAELLRDIRGLAAGLADDPPVETVSLSVTASIAISAPLSRTLWSEPPEFERIDLTERSGDSDEGRLLFAEFARMAHLDLAALRSRIHNGLTDRGSLTLRELLDQHPPESGVIDVVGYLQIACDDGHLVRRDATEEIVLPPNNGFAPLALTVPLIRFVERGTR